MKKPSYFGEREVAGVAATILRTFDQDSVKLPVELAGSFKSDESLEVPFSIFIEETKGFYSRGNVFNVWLTITLAGAAIRELLGRGGREDTQYLLSQLSDPVKSKARLYRVYEDTDRLGRP